MARRPGDMGRNLAYPNNPLGHLAPSFPTPASNNVHVNQALHQDNSELVPPTDQRRYLFSGIVPWAFGTNPFQQGGGAGPIHSSGMAQPLDVAALVAALNNFESRPFQPNEHITGWSLGQQAQQQQVTRYPGPSDRGVWGLLQPARDARFTQEQATIPVAPYGSNAGAPQVGSYRYGGPSWAPRPAGPAYLVGRGRSAQAGVASSKPTKSLEEFLREQGVPVPVVVDELPVLDDTADEYDAMVAELLRDPAEEPGRVGSAGLLIGAGENVLPPPAVGFRSGPSRDQLGLGTVRVAQPSFGAGTVGGRSSYGRAVAAVAREQRSKKMAEKKVAAAKARAQKLAAARGTSEDT